jgi:hypothetical protein
MPRLWLLCCSASTPPLGRFNLVWQGFTLENWRHPLRDQALTDAFLTDALLHQPGLFPGGGAAGA